MMIRRIPSVLSSELYAIPALIGAGCAVAAHGFGYDGTLPALGAAAVCFVTRMIGVRFDLNAPRPPGFQSAIGSPSPFNVSNRRVLDLGRMSRVRELCSPAIPLLAAVESIAIYLDSSPGHSIADRPFP